MFFTPEGVVPSYAHLYRISRSLICTSLAYAEMVNAKSNDSSRLLPQNIVEALRIYLIAHPTIDCSDRITGEYSGFFGRTILKNTRYHDALRLDFDFKTGPVKHIRFPEVRIFIEIERVVRIVKSYIKLFESSCTDAARFFSLSTDSPTVLQEFCNHIVDLHPTEGQCSTPNEISGFRSAESLACKTLQMRRETLRQGVAFDKWCEQANDASEPVSIRKVPESRQSCLPQRAVRP